MTLFDTPGQRGCLHTVTEPRPLEGVKKLTAGQIGAFGRARREGSGSVAGLNVVEDGLGGFGYVGS